ncbi:hypothetical protein V1351_09320 [Janibacter alittae]|uniref:Transposase n=1 Tax=Janibacter alittae TaxID=3115209 RepID=A0ABZ2MDQ0_9MICO
MVFVRKSAGRSGATKVQIAERRDGRNHIIEHVGTARSDAELAVLMAEARRRLRPGQEALDLDLDDEDGQESGRSGVITSKRSALLWHVLSSVYERLGFDVVADEAFKELVLARIIEPTSKADSLRVLGEVGVEHASLRTMFRSLARAQERGYRDEVAAACFTHAASSGDVSLCLYDVTVRREALVVRVEVRDLCLIPCRSRESVAGGSLIAGTCGRAGAAPTKPCRVSTVGWRGRGEQAEEVYARNRCHHLS